MTERSSRDKGVEIPSELVEYVDEGVREKLPPGTQVQGISPSGASFWTRSAKINAINDVGDETPFFIKVQQYEHGKNVLSSEFESMERLYKVMPEMVVEPVAWGAYKEQPDTYFYLCRFYELSDEIPSVSDFPALMAEFHDRAASKSGEFGFPVTTYGGRNPHTFPMNKNWEACFSRALEATFEMEETTQGADEEMRRLREGMMAKVIPRLLRPLYTEGRILTPTLVHGNLWDGNASVNVATGLPMIYDATALYAHREYELGPWSAPRHQMSNAYIEEYFQHCNKSEPSEDCEDRVALYGLRFDLHASSLYAGKLQYRLICMDTMRRLVNKYPLGYEGYQLEKSRGRLDD